MRIVDIHCGRYRKAIILPQNVLGVILPPVMGCVGVLSRPHNNNSLPHTTSLSQPSVACYLSGAVIRECHLYLDFTVLNGLGIGGTSDLS